MWELWGEGDCLKDLRLEIKIKNNLIWKRIKDKFGDISVAEFCRINNLYQTEVGKYLTFKKNPVGSKKPRGLGKIGLILAEIEGENYFWKKIPVRLAEILDCEPAELFPEHLRETRKNQYAIEVESRGLLSEGIYPSPEKYLIDGELKETISNLIETLTPREEKVLKARFGINGQKTESLEDIGKKFNVEKERIRQIEEKALRKMRHPSKSKLLRPYVE